METARAWLELADECEDAAGALLLRGSWRSSASRSYYAAYSAAHCVLFHLGQAQTPARGNWSHAAIPLIVRKVLETSFRDRAPGAMARNYEQCLRTCWAIRVLADYGPTSMVDRRAAQKSYSAAIGLVRLARELLK